MHQGFNDDCVFVVKSFNYYWWFTATVVIAFDSRFMFTVNPLSWFDIGLCIEPNCMDSVAWKDRMVEDLVFLKQHLMVTAWSRIRLSWTCQMSDNIAWFFFLHFGFHWTFHLLLLLLADALVQSLSLSLNPQLNGWGLRVLLKVPGWWCWDLNSNPSGQQSNILTTELPYHFQDST